MGIENYITDPMNHKKAQVDCPEGEKQSLIVSTRPLKEFDILIQPFFNPIFGIDLNINGSTGAEPSGGTSGVIEDIYDGNDNPYWLGSIITGTKWDLVSPVQSHDGIQSIESVNSLAGDTVQFSRPSGNLPLAPYVSLTMWIYVASGWSALDTVSIYGWETFGSIQIGGKVGLQDYFSSGTTGVWQKIVIPLVDMALSGQTLDSFRVQIENRDTSGPTFYMDEIQLEGLPVGGGDVVGPTIFKVQPPINQWYHVKEIITVLAAPVSFAPNVQTGGTVPYLDYSTLLGLELEVGILFQRIVKNQVAFSFSTLGTGDVLAIPNTTINLWGDEKTTFLQYRNVFYKPIILKGRDGDEMRLVVNDDLSGLLRMQSSLGGFIENRDKPQTPEDLTILNRALK